MSCGGQIYLATQQGKSILIVTVTAGDVPDIPLSDFAKSLHQRWETPTMATALRRSEDEAACSLLRCDFIHWPIIDCIYRRHPLTGEALYQSEAALFGPLHESENPLVDDLTRMMAALPPADQILIPMGVGHHVDHQLARLAAERWLDSQCRTYYEEFPYVQTAEVYPAQIQASVKWSFETIPLTSAALEAKIAAIACYRSQLSTFFVDLADLSRQVADYATAVGGERLWHTQKSSRLV